MVRSSSLILQLMTTPIIWHLLKLQYEMLKTGQRMFEQVLLLLLKREKPSRGEPAVNQSFDGGNKSRQRVRAEFLQLVTYSSSKSVLGLAQNGLLLLLICRIDYTFFWVEKWLRKWQQQQQQQHLSNHECSSLLQVFLGRGN